MAQQMLEKLPKTAQQQYAQLKQWVDSQPHFPKNIDEKLIIRFLHSNYYDIEKAKENAEVFFSLRASIPDLLSKRDPCSPRVQKTIKITNLAVYNVPVKKNLWVWQLNDPGLEQYDYAEDARLFILCADAWLLENTELQEEDVPILDVKDLSLRFLTKLNVFIAKKLSKYQEEAMPIRLKELHIVNCPPVIDKLFAVMKPFLKQEMINMIHFHTPKSTTLYDYLSKDELPADFGGNLEPLSQKMTKSVEMMMKYREVLMDESLWKSTKKDKKQNDSVEVGSFRSLAID